MHYLPYQKFCESSIEQHALRSLDLNFEAVLHRIDFTSNDYLQLSKHPKITEALCSYIKLYGIGATGSRLLSGNYKIFIELEEKIACVKNTEAALVFNSGYQANATVLSALLDERILGQKAIVFFDKLNHSSLYNGVLLSGSEIVRYRHCDMNHLESLLAKYASDKRPKYIISETLFGMDGDISDISVLIQFARQYNALLYLDEAHATGMFGVGGYGISTMYDFSDIQHIIMGTFSKALGASGGYIACAKIIHSYLINKCSGFLYSTAMLPAIAYAMSFAIDLLPSLKHLRQSIIQKSKILKDNLIKSGYDISNSAKYDAQIIPIIMKNNTDTMLHKEKLKSEGILVSAIRPPTVPTPRLRIAISAAHSNEDISKFTSLLRR